MSGLVSLDGAEGVTSVGVDIYGRSIRLLSASILTSTLALENTSYPMNTLYSNANPMLVDVPAAWPVNDMGGRRIRQGPSLSPTAAPTFAPSLVPTDAPTNAPTDTTTIPTNAPTSTPSTGAPTNAPTDATTGTPTNAPTSAPSTAATTAPALEPVAVSITVNYANYTASTFEFGKLKTAMISAMTTGGIGEVQETDITINATHFPTVQLFIVPSTREQGGAIEDFFSSPDIDEKLDQELIGAGFPGTIIIVYVIEKHYVYMPATQNDGEASNSAVLVVLLVIVVLLVCIIAIDHFCLDGKFRQLRCCSTRRRTPVMSAKNDHTSIAHHHSNPMFEALEPGSFHGFVNYRVWCDKDVAEKLYYALKSEGSVMFWDKACLKDGAGWEAGFVQGLQKSSKFLALISEKGLDGIIDNAATSQDNVLKEYELAVDRLQEDSTYIVPVLVGEYVSVDGAEMLKKFSAFGGLKGKGKGGEFRRWPDEYSTTCKTRTIKQTMEKLFSIQGIHLDPQQMEIAVDRIRTALVSKSCPCPC
jgi:hypothetical protein